MRLARKIMLASLVVFLMAGAARAQVLKQVPDNALAVLKVSNLEGTNKKVADLAASLGLVQTEPDMADPLGAFLKSIGVTQGVNRTGELAFAYLDTDAYKVTNDKSFLLLIPVSDYTQFVGNFADAKADGDVTEVHFKESQDPTYLAHWGDYAAASPAKEIVAKPPAAAIVIAGMAAKEVEGKDAVLLANMKALRVKVLPEIEKARLEAPKQIDDQIQQNPKIQIPGQGEIDATKLAPLAKVVVNQLLNVAQEFMQDANAVTLGINLSPDGIATTTLADFQPDSSIGKHVVKMKDTDASLLTGLGDGKYLIYGGAAADPTEMAQVWSNFLAPIQTAITALGPDYASLNDFLNAYMKMGAATRGGQFAMIAPTAPPGQASLMQFFALRRGDAKTLFDSMHQAFDAQLLVMKAVGYQSPIDQKWIPAAKTVDGVVFDEMQSSMGTDPNAQQLNQMMTMLYGPAGMTVYSGMANDQTVLTTMGLDDAAISAAIAAIKSGDDPLAKSPGVKAVAAQLPAERMSVTYIALDLWATTGLGYAKQFGMDMGVVLPDNLPPVGVTLGSDGSAIRVDSYVPTQLIQALTAAGMQMYMKAQAPHGAGPGGAPPAPGGL